MSEQSPPRATHVVTGIGQAFTGRPADGAAGDDPTLARSTFVPELLTDVVVAAGARGRILYVGPESGLEVAVDVSAADVYDADGRLATPGLIDAHTHLVFAGRRHEEYALRCLGATYQELAEAGGGIRASTRAFREVDAETLQACSRLRLDAVLAHGTTTIEIKGGYGLDLEQELKALAVIGALAEEGPQRVVGTFLGAHAVPDEYQGRQADYVDRVVDEMLPAVADQGIARFCDVFCEAGYFSVAESERILEAGKAHGLLPKIHSDEFEALGGTELAARLGAASADHLTAITDGGIRALAASGTVGVLLPGTTLFLGKQDYAPARRMLEAGVAVALATDFNPGSSTFISLPVITTIACSQLKMHPAEALAGITSVAARALRLEQETGRLEAGLAADLVLWEADDYRMIPYAAGHPLVHRVLIGGVTVWKSISGICR
jgi:imidazolonepropionase